MSAINADIGKSAMEEALVSALHRLGFDTLRKEQDRVVKAFISGQDVFAALPTGYGKSLCFALLPYAVADLGLAKGGFY